MCVWDEIGLRTFTSPKGRCISFVKESTVPTSVVYTWFAVLLPNTVISSVSKERVLYLVWLIFDPYNRGPFPRSCGSKVRWSLRETNPKWLGFQVAQEVRLPGRFRKEGPQPIPIDGLPLWGPTSRRCGPCRLRRSIRRYAATWSRPYSTCIRRYSATNLT